MDSPGAPSGSGRGEKRPASDAADADLFKRGGPKSIRASAAPRWTPGTTRGDAGGAGDDGSRAPATSRRGRRGRRWRSRVRRGLPGRVSRARGRRRRRQPAFASAAARQVPRAVRRARAAPERARGQRDRGGVARGAGRRGGASPAGQAPDPYGVPGGHARVSVPGGDGVSGRDGALRAPGERRERDPALASRGSRAVRRYGPRFEISENS